MDGLRGMTATRRTVALILLILVYFMDGYDLNAMALAVPRLEGALGLAPAAFGWVFSLLLVGMGIAAAVLAPLGDRLGRRTLICGGCLVVAVATMATASATSIGEFLVWRTLTGVGLGTCLPNVTALSAELAPARLKATIMSVASAGIPLGLAAAGFLTPPIVAASGWQGLFFVPGVLASVLAVVLWLVLPGGPPQAAVTQPANRLPQAELLKQPWALPFAVFAGALALNAVNLYLVNSWLPTVLPKAGFTLDSAAQFAGTLQLVGLALGIAVSALIDRWRPAATMVITFAVIAACFAAIGLMGPDPASWTALLMVAVGGASAAGMALPALSAYLFPSRLLGTAMGMGVLIGRAGAIGAPLVGGAMLDAGVSPSVFLGTAAGPALVAMLICLGLPAALSVRKREEPAATS
jgi:AAHS family 4-hydroxybenzoate transporter-like MFS transporter